MRIQQENAGVSRTTFSHNPQKILDKNVQAFVDQLAHSDRSLLDAFKLTVDGVALTEEEATRFIAFIRRELNVKKPVSRRTRFLAERTAQED